MSKLEELIQRYCPDGVEWKTFFEVCDLIRGITYNKEQEAKAKTEDAHKVLRANNITLQLNALNFEDVKLVVKDVVVKPSQHLYAGDILMCAGSGSKEHVGKVAYIAENMDYTFGGFMAVVRSKESIHPRFLFHILTSAFFSNHLDVQINSSTINNINKQVMQSFSFPVPPLPVQEEIVRILDTFTELQAELQAELQKRKQQYNYYRDHLLSFEGRTNVEWKPISTVAQVCRGVRVVKSQLSNEGYPVFQNCLTPMGFFDKTNCPGGTPFVICGGAAGNVGYSYVDCWAADDCEYIIGGQRISNRFIYHCLMTKSDFLLSQVRKASIPRLSPSVIKELKIPVPSLSEQQKIVDILDRFDTLTGDLAAGLPAEIEKRKQQYEYYRDKLLTFKHKKS